MIALVVLAIGVLAVAQMFPAGTRRHVQDRMGTAGTYHAQAKLEELAHLSWSDPNLAIGRHPPGTATEDLGSSGKWHRYYEVSSLPGAFDNVRKVTVTVNWTFMGQRSVQVVTYVRR